MKRVIKLLDISIGDIVSFKEDKKHTPYTVSWLINGKDIELKEVGSDYYFPAEMFDVVEKCRYQNGDRVKLIAVFWHDEKKEFQEEEIMGTVRGGFIDFDKRTYDHYRVCKVNLNEEYPADRNGVDYDCAFCEPSEENIRKAKLSYLRRLTSKVEDLKEDYEDANSQLLAMRQQIGG